MVLKANNTECSLYARHYRNPLTFILLAQQSHEENEAQKRNSWTEIPIGGRAGIYIQAACSWNRLA